MEETTEITQLPRLAPIRINGMLHVLAKYQTTTFRYSTANQLQQNLKSDGCQSHSIHKTVTHQPTSISQLPFTVMDQSDSVMATVQVHTDIVRLLLVCQEIYLVHQDMMNTRKATIMAYPHQLLTIRMIFSSHALNSQQTQDVPVAEPSTTTISSVKIEKQFIVTKLETPTIAPLNSLRKIQSSIFSTPHTEVQSRKMAHAIHFVLKYSSSVAELPSQPL